MSDKLKHLESLQGLKLEPSDWLTVDQKMIDAFGDLSLDQDPFHQDPEWASLNSPFGSTIAYGFLTMSLLSHFQKTAFMKSMSQLGEALGTVGMPINYGFDKLRFIAPVPAGSRIRGAFKIQRYEVRPDGAIAMYIGCVVEIEDHARPALAGDWVFLLAAAE